jgi:hypothetical protein
LSTWAVPVTGAFEFWAPLFAYTDELRTGAPVFGQELVGSGTALVWFSDPCEGG